MKGRSPVSASAQMADESRVLQQLHGIQQGNPGGWSKGRGAENLSSCQDRLSSSFAFVLSAKVTFTGSAANRGETSTGMPSAIR